MSSRGGYNTFGEAEAGDYKVSIKENFEVCLAHCTCMAGLGEVCSHVGGLLFYLLACSDHLQKFSTDACTSNLCSWLPPSAKEIKIQ